MEVEVEPELPLLLSSFFVPFGGDELPLLLSSFLVPLSGEDGGSFDFLLGEGGGPDSLSAIIKSSYVFHLLLRVEDRV